MFELHFHPKEKFFPCTNNFEKSSDFPVYISEQKELYSYNKTLYKSVVFQIYYTENGAIGLGKSLFPKSKFLGYHLIDIERIIILYDLISNEPAYVYFSAHRDEGKWVKYSDCEFTPQGDLIVYVAKYSHANYPSPGTWFRIYGFANDLCSTKGIKIRPTLKKEFKTYTVPNKEKRELFCSRFFYV